MQQPPPLPPPAAPPADEDDGVWHPLFARTGGGMRYDLACMHRLLACLGNPQRALRVVMVAGTNGKGSTSALLARAAQQAGLRVGLFTSPHLVHFAERVRVDGVPVSAAALLQDYHRLLRLEPKLPRPFSFFEASVAMACLAFARAKVSLAIFEAGLGGRLDATNIFASEARLVCALSRVDLDHQAVLGRTRVAIAAEKAAIWRPHRPAVLGLQTAAVTAACRRWARARAVPLACVSAPMLASLDQPMPAVAGWPAFMRENAALALLCARALAAQGLPVRDADVAGAAHNFVWPGRYQVVRPARANGPAVWVDAGHNPAGCRALARALATDVRLQGKRLHLVVGALADKDLPAMLRALRPVANTMTLCATAGARGRDVHQLAGVHKVGGRPPAIYANVAAALATLTAGLCFDDVICVTGSLTLVADTMRWCGTKASASL